jgi:hypothetical protein
MVEEQRSASCVSRQKVHNLLSWHSIRCPIQEAGNLRVVMEDDPLTDWKDRYSKNLWHIRIDPDKTNGLAKAFAVD